MKRHLVGLLAICVLAILARTAVAEMHPADLRCEFRDNPLGVDVAHPNLSWILATDDNARGQNQTAYQVLAASTADVLKNDKGDLWDSGIVKSDQCNFIAYKGKDLSSCQRVFWKVRTWDQDNKPSAWSAPAKLVTGIMRPDDWKAKWIDGSVLNPIADQPAAQPPAAQTPAVQTPVQTPAPPPQQLLVLRRSFTPKAAVKSAIINICGLGQYELSLNGEKVGDEELTPGWTNYRKTCLYNTYDVTDKLAKGENALGIMLGNGMYNVPKTRDIGRYTKFSGTFGQPKVIAQLDIVYADGTTESIVTDKDWRSAKSPIVFSNTYGGEDYDARLEPAGWNKPGFKDADWTAAVETTGPGGSLYGISRSAPAIKVAQVFTPVKVTNPKSGIYVYDLGQNCSLMPQITVHGSAGATVKLIPGELLLPDGSISQLKLSAGLSSMSYTLRGDENETWGPRFFYYGSRYIQVEGAVPPDADNPNKLPVVNQLVGRFVTSASPIAGEFSCSSDLFNRTATLIRWAMRNNMESVLTDCPHREKLGWLEQDHLVGSSLMYNFNVAALFNKICDDMADAQTAEGLVPNIAPEYTVFKGDFRDSPEWSSASILIPWQLYQWYGDRQVLEDHYDTMRRYVDYLTSRADNGIVSHGLGDWFDLGPKGPGVSQLTPKWLTATGFYYRDTQLVSQFAKLLGKNEDAAKYANQAEKIRTAFNQYLYNPTAHSYATGSQTANSIPLVFGIVPKEEREGVVKSLVDDVRKHDNGLTAGDVGYKYLVRALADAGQSDVIFDMNSRSDRPGYGYILKKGATALTESWDGTHSQDHFMLGHIMEWFYGDLAGIKCDADSTAFKKIVIKPAPVGNVTWAKADYDCPYGKIKTAWKLTDGKFTLDVTIPPGTTATVYLPSDNKTPITESGADAAQAKSVKPGKFEAGYMPMEVASGEYHFQSTVPNSSPVASVQSAR